MVDAGPKFARSHAARRELGCDRREDVATVKGQAGFRDIQPIEVRLSQSIHDRAIRAVEHRCKESIVWRHEDMVVVFHDDDVSPGADSRIDNRDVDGACREVVIRTANPESGFVWPVGWNVMRQIDDACISESLENDAFHYGGKRAFVPEIRC